MGRLAAIGIVIAGILVAWHLIIWTKLPSNANINVNPFTDVAHVKALGASQLGFTDPGAIAAFNGARDVVGGTVGERQLTNLSREYFDVYAMILPYHVIISDEKPPIRISYATRSQPVTPSSTSPLAPEAARTGEYVNERFGLRFSRPQGFTAGSSPENGDGVELTSKDGAAVIRAWGSNSSGGQLQEYYDEYLEDIGVVPSYSHVGNGWFVLSWTKGGRITYVKMFVGTASQNAFSFEYPEDQADLYNPINTQIERSFRHGDLSQSW